MNKVELLAPAGSKESLYAAINKGADAVYLGGAKFSARAYASNFDEKALEEAVDYAHMYGVKVYITINTLIKEKELREVIEYVGFLYRIGVDALIIQDLGVFNEIRKKFPDFELHASTQMTIHNGDGALFFKESGFHRVVLSRELSLDEIKYISKELAIETEIFVHGALCICYSGQCLMSSIIGGRSGNRGRCAQSCRLPYSIIKKENGELYKGYLLSPKDMCTIDDIGDIIESGADSLKIEGRMKRPEYVAGVVESYREAIQNHYAKKYSNTENHKKVLMKLFNREGFSKAYLYKNVGKDMMAFNMPKNTGIFVGMVNANGEIDLVEDVSLGDGIRCGEDGFTISKILKNNKEVLKAFRGESVKVFPKNYRRGDRIYKTSDVELLEKLKLSYINPFDKKILVNAEVKFEIGKPLYIKIIYKDIEFEVQGDLVQQALKKPLSIEKIKENLGKSGDIPYKIESIRFSSFDEGFLPISSLNNARREILQKIMSFEIEKHKRQVPVKNYLNNRSVNDKSCVFPEFTYVVNTKEQLRALMDLDIENIVIDIFGKYCGAIKIEDLDKLDLTKVYIKVPNIIKKEVDFVCNILDKYIKEIKGIVTANVGIISRYKGRTEIIGDYKLNIFNSSSAEFYSNHINLIPISVELNRKEIADLAKNYNHELQQMIYGKIEIMVSEYCPIGSTFGGKCENKQCDQPCVSATFELEDRMKERFVVRTDRFCRSHIYNNVPTNLIEELKELKNIGITCFRVDFVDEDYEEVVKVIKMLQGSLEASSSKYTKGHYRRGVE